MARGQRLQVRDRAANIDAVHDLDGFDSGDLSAKSLIELGKEAIDWWMPEARPHTTERWQELLDDLDPIRELVAMIEHMAEMGDRSPPPRGTHVVVDPRAARMRSLAGT